MTTPDRAAIPPAGPVVARDRSAARQRFAAARVQHLATADAAGRPHLVPVTAAVLAHDGADVVVFAVDGKPKRTQRLRRLANIAARPAVALLADHYDEDWTRLWWVRADADAVVLDPADPAAADRVAAALAALAAKYPQYRAEPPGGPVVWAVVTRWRGWSARLPL